MPLILTPEVGIPLPLNPEPSELQTWSDRARAAVNTIKTLLEAGGSVEVSDEDRAASYDMMNGSRKVVIADEYAGTLLHLDALLSEYDKELLNSATRLRSYVTNKLIQESADPDAKVRLKALELLGKITEVGLFSDRLDVNVRHQSVEQVDAELNNILEKYMGSAVVVDAPIDTPELPRIDLNDVVLDDDMSEVVGE